MHSHESHERAGRQVHSVTDVNEAASIEAHKRFRAYGIKMALRIVLMIAGAIVAQWNLWIALALLLVAALIPWFAVVSANVVKVPRSGELPEFLKAPPAAAVDAGRPEETGGPATGRQPGRPEEAEESSGETIPGQWYDEPGSNP